MANQQLNNLLASQSPELARILDRRERLQQQQQRMQPTNYGTDPMGRMLTAWSGAIRGGSEAAKTVVDRATGQPIPMGVRERANLDQKKAIEEQQRELQAQQQAEQQQRMQDIGNKKMFAVNIVNNNSSLSDQQKQAYISNIKLDPTGSYTDGLVKALGVESQTVAGNVKATNFGNDGSVSIVTDEGVLKTLKPADPKPLQDYVNTSKLSPKEQLKVQAIYTNAVKQNKPEAEIIASLNKAIKEPIPEFISKRFEKELEQSEGYGVFTRQFDYLVSSVENANTGLTGDFLQDSKKLISEVFNIPIASIKDSEVIDRFFNAQVLDAAGLMAGSLSDADIRFLKLATGDRGFSKEGLKQALVDLAVSKELAREVSEAYRLSDNKSTFDFEDYKMDNYNNVYNKYAKKANISTTQSRTEATLPDGAVSFEDLPN